MPSFIMHNTVKFQLRNIISFVSGNNTPFVLDTKKVNMEEVIEQFPQYIATMLESVYNPEEPFKHSTAQFVSFCKYCE